MPINTLADPGLTSPQRAPMVRPGQSPNDGDIEGLDPRFLSPHPPMLMVNPLTAADNEPRSGSSWTNSGSRRPKIIMCHG